MLTALQMIIQNSTKTSHLAKNISSIKALPISNMQNCLHKIIKFRKVFPDICITIRGKVRKRKLFRQLLS